MKKISYILPFIIFACFLAFSPTKTFAAYDPNLVISDAQLTAKNTMSEQQIQDFLVAKGSFLANFTVPAPRTVTYYIDQTRTLTTFENTTIGPYGTSTEVDVRGWPASRVIWQVCQWYGVNPQVALTIIEKESSFILGRTSGRADGTIAVPGANSYATYAWVMGYAYTEDVNNPAKNVCGVATPGANPSKSCAGFAAQMDNAVWAVANWANLANAQSSGNDYGCSYWSGSYRTNYATRLCDGDWITPRSGATAALYRYTPHTGLSGGYSGNRAFYLLYSNWFDEITWLKDNIPLTSLRVSNPSPARGETLVTGFTLRNNLSTSITLSNVGMFARQNGKIVDFGWSGPATLAAGQSLSFDNQTLLLPNIGNLNITPGFIYNNNYYFLSQHANTYPVRYPDIMVITLPNSAPAAPSIGQPMTVSAAIQNLESRPINFENIGIFGRLNGANLDVGWGANVTIQPQNVYVMSGSVTPQTRGNYTGQIGFYMDGVWGIYGDWKNFGVN